MTPDNEPTLSFSPPRPARQWRVKMADGAVSVIPADCARCEAGCLVLMRPAGTAAIYAAGIWASAEEVVIDAAGDR